MTYDQDPARWSTDPDEAPELLRGAFAASRKEGPNRGQMRSLAVKLAAASAGGAVAVGTVKAASAGNTIATAATWSAAKIAGVIALAGSVVAGTVVWRSSESAPTRTGQAPTHASPSSAEPPAELAAPTEAAPAAPGVSHPSAAPTQAVPQAATGTAQVEPLPQATPSTPRVEALPQVEAARAAEVGRNNRAPSQAPPQPAGQTGSTSKSTAAEARTASASSPKPQPAQRSASKPAERTGSASAAARASNPRNPSIVSSPGTVAPPSEVSLLRSAQVALQSRPREAFQLTQQHRRLYPAGEFAQERDALAIQALMRAGETEQARDLAQAFIRAYPGSPHAHRFREAMGIR